MNAADIEVIVIGSAGVWAKAPTLDAAKRAARKIDSTLGSGLVVVVAPKAAGVWVDDYGCVCWTGERRHRYVVKPDGGKVWPVRSTTRLAAAVDAAVAEVQNGGAA